ncbi:MAG: exo-alpha-sialidase [Saprospiraceae bacterium]|nr:exo-alpha-sialidase [Saprospiraceae bacterium]
MKYYHIVAEVHCRPSVLVTLNVASCRNAAYVGTKNRKLKKIIGFTDRWLLANGIHLLPGIILCFLVFDHGVFAQQTLDWRLVDNGNEIYEHGYCDQPYIVVTSDGSWVCTFTTSPGVEGDQIQYIASTVSSDNGKTWSEPVEIETSSGGIEASWAIPLITDFDRVYVFYTYNGDTIRKMPDGTDIRSDTHGWYCYRYSDDKGVTWSKRQRLDVRVTKCDAENDFNGSVQMFWGIGKPVMQNDQAWFSFTKLGKYFLEEGEGWLFHSNNILTERDISQLNWTMWPDGEEGIRNDAFGSVQEEHNIQPMNQRGGLYCAYRTTLGSPAESYSYDGGRTWSEPTLIRYASGRLLRHPRACPRVWKCSNGKYLLWHHNNGGKSFSNRNPAWLSGGIEKDGEIIWSQPEIVLYSYDLSYETGRLSYPDLVEDKGRYWISTTQKTRATIHEIPTAFLEGLWSQLDQNVMTGSFLFSRGAALDFWFNGHRDMDTILLNLTTQLGPLIVYQSSDGILKVSVGSERRHLTLISDEALLADENPHHVGIMFDMDADIAFMMVDGKIVDGNGKSDFGFVRLREKWEGSDPMVDSIIFVNPAAQKWHLFNRCIGTSEMVSRFQSGLE